MTLALPHAAKNCMLGCIQIPDQASGGVQGKSGNPFFDCVTMNSDLPPFKSFVQANGNNAQTLANHFVSYLKGGLSTPDGGLADKITFENPFDPDSKPINLKFNAERPYFNLPQVGGPCIN